MEISCWVIFLQSKLEQRRKDDMETEIEKKVTSQIPPITSDSFKAINKTPLTSNPGGQPWSIWCDESSFLHCLL